MNAFEYMIIFLLRPCSHDSCSVLNALAALLEASYSYTSNVLVVFVFLVDPRRVLHVSSHAILGVLKLIASCVKRGLLACEALSCGKSCGRSRFTIAGDLRLSATSRGDSLDLEGKFGMRSVESRYSDGDGIRPLT